MLNHVDPIHVWILDHAQRFYVTREALSILTDDEHHVICSIFYGGQTEPAIAAELIRLRGRQYTRDRVHRIKLTALNKMRQHLERRMVAA